MVGVDHDRRSQCRDHFFSNLLRAFVHVASLAARQIFQDHREFVAPQTRHRITGAHARRQPRGHPLEKFIAYIVTEGIVDRFEAIKIDEHKREARTLARRIGHTLFKPVVNQHTIWQTCEWIARGQKLNPFFSAFSLGDVGRRAGHADRMTARVTTGHLAF